MIRRWTPGQWVLRALIVVASQAAIWLPAVEGVAPRWGLVVLVLGLAAFAAISPEAAGGTVLMVVMVLWWGLALRGEVPLVTVAGAAALLLTHLCITLAGYGPGTLGLDPALVRLWAARGLAAFAPVPVVWLLAKLVADQPAPPGLWAAGLAAALVAGVATSVLHTRGRRS
jgi:hypothetical protein